jgi:hypothetical protein
VNINVIDEALFAVEENYAENLLDRLYKYVIDTPGVSYTLYDLLNPNPGDGYGGGGGEARVKFEDTALARSVVTDRNGNAEVKFKLPDNLTSWRVISAAFEPERVLGGTNKQNIIATLPFFVDAVISPTYLVGDEPNIKVRLFGGNYSADVPSDLEITSESLGVSVKKTVKGSDLYVALPKLPVGIHEVKMMARQGEKQDILVRKIVVKNSYFTRQETATLNLDNDLLGLNGSKEGLTKVCVSGNIFSLALAIFLPQFIQFILTNSSQSMLDFCQRKNSSSEVSLLVLCHNLGLLSNENLFLVSLNI